MEKIIKIVSIWEDEELFEIKISSSDGAFSGNTHCYTTRKELFDLATNLKNFPKNIPSRVQFSTGPSNSSSYFSLEFNTLDNLSGNVRVRVTIEHIVIFSNTNEKEHSKVEFDYFTEPNLIDQFVKQLVMLSQNDVGTVTATLNSR